MKWILIVVAIAVAAGVLLLALRTDRTPPAAVVPMGTLIIKSSAFREGETIPAKYTCDGDDVNPLLELRAAPEGTQSFALVVDDPDAPGGMWVHWLVWNIDPRTQYISEDTVPDEAVQGKTSSKHEKYGGPCPPRGDHPHHYRFALYALDAMLTLPAGADKAALMRAMEEHILGQTVLTGLYQRK